MTAHAPSRSRPHLAALMLVFLVPISLSCSQGSPSPSDTPAPTDAELDTSQHFGGLTLQVDAPFSTASLEIGPDGAASYQASSPQTGIESVTESGTIPEDDLARLVDEVQDAGFFSLDDAYPYEAGVSYEDGSTYAIQVTVGSRTQRVTCYESECPAAFNQVLDAIREIWPGDILEVGV